ncbi:MAG: hypothetical protein E4H20_00955 [Spirochaetales bacterium]|nr:MAG: hypothetical protein E4H20_00955 [Spirochaetales bacterium]
MSPEQENSDYLRRQLIPYLGNKRSLLPRLGALFQTLSANRASIRFLDPFSGSGSVARLGRSLGYSVEANDWEPYSEAINRCWLELAPEDLEHAFGSEAELARVFSDWNAMHSQAGNRDIDGRGEPYLARWYAPAVTGAPDLNRERLFYTAENATFLDAARNRLEAEFPLPEPGSVADVKRRVFLGAILLEAAVHSNTSGVFKAYHRGFGGHGKDALQRILAKAELEVPVLVPGPTARVHRMDAIDFVRSRPADIVYLDPPYNQHQYGSNYHILNTIVRWDGAPVSLDLGEDGRLLRKAGIPESWKLTRSPFCRRPEAENAITELIDSIDAAAIVVSWNGDGHVDEERMAGILAERGRLEVRTLEYVTYRGGRQSDERQTANREYLFVVRTDQPSDGSEAAIRQLSDARMRDQALRGRYDPDRLRSRFRVSSGSVALRVTGTELWPVPVAVPLKDLRRLSPEAVDLIDSLGKDQRHDLFMRLASCRCANAQENLEALLPLAADPGPAGARARKEVLLYLRKLAHPRYQADFIHFLREFEKLEVASINGSFHTGLDGLRALAKLRYGFDSI